MGNLVGPNDLRAQTRQAFQNVLALVRAARGLPSDVVKLTVYVLNYQPDDFRIIREASRAVFDTAAPPTLSLVGVRPSPPRACWSRWTLWPCCGASSRTGEEEIGDEEWAEWAVCRAEGGGRRGGRRADRTVTPRMAQEAGARGRDGAARGAAEGRGKREEGEADIGGLAPTLGV